MTSWNYPGSRWWKFDFHTHTPASADSYWTQNRANLSPDDWLLRYMAAGIDCVAVTDHNSGTWIDPLKAAYGRMKSVRPQGFRELTIFPGVEISANAGVHVLAIFDPGRTAGDIDTLLGAVGYKGTKGDSDGVTSKGVAEVIQAIIDAGGIPVPAHADRAKGLLQCRPDSTGPALDANTLRQALEVAGLLAVEWCDPGQPWPQCAERHRSSLAAVLGSDCHSFQGNKVPGSAFTWVKMAAPTLEGLRLALLDGNGVSIRRSDEGAFDPFRVPAQLIRAIEIDQARYMGNGQLARLDLSPFFNAIVGGRGTGKSTVVHALRLATARGDELNRLADDAEPRRRFADFWKVGKGRDGEGALRDNSVIRIEWRHDGRDSRLVWRQGGSVEAQEADGQGAWLTSASQHNLGARFPLRLFSQGQIAAMAGSGRQALLALIDEAAGVAPLQEALQEARRTFLAQRARLRELDGKLAQRPELQRQFDDALRRLVAFDQSDHAAVLKAYAQGQRQQREVQGTLDALAEWPARIRQLADALLLDDWPEQTFADVQAEVLAWRSDADRLGEEMRTTLQALAAQMERSVQTLGQDPRLAAWRVRVQQAVAAHADLQTRLAAQGVSDPQAFAQLTQQRQTLEQRLKTLAQTQTDRDMLAEQIAQQQTLLLRRRQAVTQRREEFVQNTLRDNAFVRIGVAPFGFDAREIERQLREFLDVLDDRFAEDILSVENGEPSGGLAFDLARAQGSSDLMTQVKGRLAGDVLGFGGHFLNYLQRKRDKPEFADHVLAWFPEDDLRIEYQRDGRWHPIHQGSQGQRSAALLAFLLAFGDEPLVLDQPEDDLDNHLIYDLIVRQIRDNKLRRQLIVVTHNPNVVVNGDADLVHVMEFGAGQCFIKQSGALQEKAVREEVCRVMEGGHEAFSRRWKRLGREN